MAKSEKSQITAGQIKAALALLGLSQADLAEKAGVGKSTVERAISKGIGSLSTDLASKTIAVFDSGGISFTDGGAVFGGSPEPEKPALKYFRGAFIAPESIAEILEFEKEGTEKKGFYQGAFYPLAVIQRAEKEGCEPQIFMI